MRDSLWMKVGRASATSHLRQWSQGLLPQRSSKQLWTALSTNWYLGLTSFGGPPVHFKIFNDKYVKKEKWIDEQMYQELFSIAQVFSGPGSTKMLYCINLVHGGTLSAIMTFFLWSTPIAMVMYGLSIGVSNFNDKLPAPAYALLSGLNAAIVGIIALAAVELSQKAITDNLIRNLIFFTATAGLLYNALWYFPVLMIACSCTTLAHDYQWLHRPITYIFRASRRRSLEEAHEMNSRPISSTLPSRSVSTSVPLPVNTVQATPVSTEPDGVDSEPRIIPQDMQINISWKLGAATIAMFLTLFTIVMILRGVLKAPPLIFSLFANMLLAGTIIFGGGPVVVPLLREYVVAEGWVAQRDFLIGLALIQAFPGPNFNFAVFLGSLAAINTGNNSVVGALVAWAGIFLPGISLVHGTMGIWSSIRNRRWVKSILRGVNAGAIGLIYTAVYRIWQSGYINKDFQSGHSLGDDPWWLVVAALSYCSGSWYHIQPPLIIIGGAVLGLVRYGVVRS